MRETTVQIDGMMSICDGAGVERQLKRRAGVMRVNANYLSGTATIAYDETRVAPDDCIFRSKATTHSSRRRPPIPIEGDH